MNDFSYMEKDMESLISSLWRLKAPKQEHILSQKLDASLNPNMEHMLLFKPLLF